MTRTVLVGAGLFLAAALASSSALSAQMTLGIGGGVVSSTLVGDDVEGEIESQTGISVGAFLSIPIGGRISIVPGGH